MTRGNDEEGMKNINFSKHYCASFVYHSDKRSYFKYQGGKARHFQSPKTLTRAKQFVMIKLE